MEMDVVFGWGGWVTACLRGAVHLVGCADLL